MVLYLKDAVRFCWQHLRQVPSPECDNNLNGHMAGELKGAVQDSLQEETADVKDIQVNHGAVDVGHSGAFPSEPASTHISNRSVVELANLSTLARPFNPGTDAANLAYGAAALANLSPVATLPKIAKNIETPTAGGAVLATVPYGGTEEDPTIGVGYMYHTWSRGYKKPAKTVPMVEAELKLAWTQPIELETLLKALKCHIPSKARVTVPPSCACKHNQVVAKPTVASSAPNSHCNDGIEKIAKAATPSTAPAIKLMALNSRNLTIATAACVPVAFSREEKNMAMLKDLTDKVSSLEHGVSRQTANETLLKDLRVFVAEPAISPGPNRNYDESEEEEL